MGATNLSVCPFDKDKENAMEKKSEQKPIDVAKLIQKLWASRMLYVKILPAVLIVTYMITLCMPRYYTCTMELAPESSEGGSSTLASMASSFGLGKIGLNSKGDAISTSFYPDLVNSPNFIVTVFSIKVQTLDGKVNTSYYDYIDKHQKTAVWNRFIFNPISKLFRPADTTLNVSNPAVNVRNLSHHQQIIVKTIQSKIKCTIDKKTDAINISVTDQDPLVCAIVGDSILARIQSFLVDYRTKKARNDYAYYKSLRDEAKTKYERARQQYATVSDANVDVTLRSVSSKIDEMENEMQLLYNNYTALAAQTLAAQAKIQENTPAFTPITTAVIPIKPAGPKRSIIAIMVTLIAAIGISIYIIYPKKKQ